MANFLAAPPKIGPGERLAGQGTLSGYVKKHDHLHHGRRAAPTVRWIKSALQAIRTRRCRVKIDSRTCARVSRFASNPSLDQKSPSGYPDKFPRPPWGPRPNRVAAETASGSPKGLPDPAKGYPHERITLVIVTRTEHYPARGSLTEIASQSLLPQSAKPRKRSRGPPSRSGNPFTVRQKTRPPSPG